MSDDEVPLRRGFAEVEPRVSVSHVAACLRALRLFDEGAMATQVRAHSGLPKRDFSEAFFWLLDQGLIARKGRGYCLPGKGDRE